MRCYNYNFWLSVLVDHIVFESLFDTLDEFKAIQGRQGDFNHDEGV